MGRELQNSEQGEKKSKANLKEKGSWVDDVDGGGVLEGGSVMGDGDGDSQGRDVVIVVVGRNPL